MSKGNERYLLVAYKGRIEETEEVYAVGLFTKGFISDVVKNILEDENETELAGEDLNFAYVPVSALSHVKYHTEAKVTVL